MPESVEREAEIPSAEGMNEEKTELSSLERGASLQKQSVQESPQQVSEVVTHDEKRPKTQAIVAETMQRIVEQHTDTQHTILQGICSHLQQHGQELLHRLQQEQLLPAAAAVDTVTPETLAWVFFSSFPVETSWSSSRASWRSNPPPPPLRAPPPS